MIDLGGELERFVCSRAGCTESAVWRIEWRNPAIHTADRVKVWLACDEHREFLSEFLRARDFPVSVVAIDGVAIDPAAIEPVSEVAE